MGAAKPSGALLHAAAKHLGCWKNHGRLAAAKRERRLPASACPVTRNDSRPPCFSGWIDHVVVNNMVKCWSVRPKLWADHSGQGVAARPSGRAADKGASVKAGAGRSRAGMDDEEWEACKGRGPPLLLQLRPCGRYGSPLKRKVTASFGNAAKNEWARGKRVSRIRRERRESHESQVTSARGRVAGVRQVAAPRPAPRPDRFAAGHRASEKAGSRCILSRRPWVCGGGRANVAARVGLLVCSRF
jgi:hypothetical protein